MEFCPTCGLLVQYQKPYMGFPSKLFCPTCPYVCSLDNKVKIKRSQRLIKKEVDTVVSKQEEDKLAQKTEVTCPKCSHDKARYEMHQTRGADEPATIYYECSSCAHKWNSL